MNKTQAAALESIVFGGAKGFWAVCQGPVMRLSGGILGWMHYRIVKILLS